MSNGIRPTTLDQVEQAIQAIYARDPAGFEVNVSEISRSSGISRPTLSKPEMREHIKACVARLPHAHDVLQKAMSEEQKANQRLRKECAQLKVENSRLLMQLTELFSRIYGESVDVQKTLYSQDCEERVALLSEE